MKKRIFICTIITFAIAIGLSGIYQSNIIPDKSDKMCGVWLSYYEQSFNVKNEKEFEKSAEALYNKLINNKIGVLFLHVRANCDAIYPSDIFSYSQYYLDDKGNVPSFNPLKILLSSAKKKGIEVHAWVNPYRVSKTVASISELPDNHAAKILFSEDENSIIEWNGGIYLNPGNKTAQRLITSGIRELIEYDFAGIHFDDYFYPTSDEEFDSETYNKYLEDGGTLELSDWRRANVNMLVSSVYQIVHSNNLIFGISPMADIPTNYGSYYADIEKWILEDGYIDYIAPQIYYGFNHPYKPFSETFNQWVKLSARGNKKLFVGLAAYKQGKTDEYISKKYKKESREWIENKNLLAEEAKVVIDDKYASGFIVFSYTNYFKDENFSNRNKIAQLLH